MKPTVVTSATRSIDLHKSTVNLSEAATKKKTPNNVFKTDYRLMQVKSIAKYSRRALHYFNS